MEDTWSPYRRYRRYLDRGFVELPTLIFPIVISGVQPRIARLATKCSSGGKTYTASMEFKYAMYQSSKDESIANKETLTFRQNGAWASSEDSPWRTVLIILWKDKRTRWLELCNSQEPQSEGNLCCRIRWTIRSPIKPWWTRRGAQRNDPHLYENTTDFLDMVLAPVTDLLATSMTQIKSRLHA